MFFNCKMPTERGCLFGRNHTTELGLTQLPLSLDGGLNRIWSCSSYTQLLFCLAKVIVSILLSSYTAYSTPKSWKEENLLLIFFQPTLLRYMFINCKIPVEKGYLFSRTNTTELGTTQLLLSLGRSLNFYLVVFLLFTFFSFALQRFWCSLDLSAAQRLAVYGDLWIYI